MRSRFSGLLTLLFLLVSTQTSYAATTLETLARAAGSAEPTAANRAIAELRELGPAGLETLRHVYAREIEEQISNPLLAPSPEWQRLSGALDAVSQQKDSYLSGLYWYTDLGAAKEAARASGKPILSLRLLGKLSEEYSCANSRFFRTILYSNAQVSQALRDGFILHWQSERPAPRVTIDFGDGRKLERTLTGNSIHYILDADGRPLDALPGLYGPGAFLRALGQAEAALKQPASARGTSLPTTLFPRIRLNAINVAWASDIETTGGKIPAGLIVSRDQNGTPRAIEIASLAMAKSVTELSVLKSMTEGAETLGKVTDEATWNKIAQLHFADAQLDARSLGLIQRQTQNALSAAAPGKHQTFKALVDKLQRNIALDTVRNEYLMHTRIYAWLIANQHRDNLSELNKKVYAELFLTPATDPWLGLFSAEVYTALDGGGISH